MGVEKLSEPVTCWNNPSECPELLIYLLFSYFYESIVIDESKSMFTRDDSLHVEVWLNEVANV